MQAQHELQLANVHCFMGTEIRGITVRQLLSLRKDMQSVDLAWLPLGVRARLTAPAMP